MNKNCENAHAKNDVGWLFASDIMQHEVVSVRTFDTLEEVERALADAKVSGVPVLGAGDRVVGVLSKSDLVDRYAMGEDPVGMDLNSVDEDGNEVTLECGSPRDGQPTAGDLMTLEVESIAPDANLRQVAARMVDSQIHRLLVVDKRGELVGIVSTIDILRALAG